MLMGIGIALTMSPMSTAAMNAVNVQKAGVASGVLSMSRMVGGSLGVAATGAIFQSSSAASFNPAQPSPRRSEQARATFVDALGKRDGPRGDRGRRRIWSFADARSDPARARRRTNSAPPRRQPPRSR